VPASVQEIRSEWNPVNGCIFFFLTEFDPLFVFNLLSEWLCDQAQVHRSGEVCLHGLRRVAR
jgi:hypothetical protein